MTLDNVRIAIDTPEDHPHSRKAEYCKTELLLLLANHKITDQIYRENLIRINRASLSLCLQRA